jgi:hypothetical protein
MIPLKNDVSAHDIPPEFIIDPIPWAVDSIADTTVNLFGTKTVSELEPSII